MKKTFVVIAAALILSPSMAFAATPKEQYISFLELELTQLEAELASLEAPVPDATTTMPVASTTGAVEVPTVDQSDATTTATTTESTPSQCIETRSNFAGSYCVSWVF